MSEKPETPTTAATVAAAPSIAKPYWLYRFAAWVVIVAGILFIVTTIFFAGFRIAGHHGHHWHHHGHHHHAMVHHGGQRGPHGGAGSGGPSSAVPGPEQPPASIAPSTAPARP